MASGEITSTMVLAILPEIGLVVLAAILLLVDLLWKGEQRRWFGWLTAGGVAVIMALAIVFSIPGSEPVLVWGGMLRFDMAGFVFRMIFLTGAGLTALFAAHTDAVRLKGEFYALLLVSTLGMSLMASSADLIMLFLAIETTSIPLYVLTGFILRDQKSVEAGIKYLLFGSMASAILLYGFSLLYGFTGNTQLYGLGSMLQTANIPTALIVGVIGLVLVGFGFKVSAVPLHFWAPDVYQGAPTPVAGFLSTASKAAGFAALMRVMAVAFPEQSALWSTMIAVIATASMLVGNYLALVQKNLKRLLAYSSIAQAGYMLIGVAAGTELGYLASTYYLMAYLVTNLAAFGVVAWVEHNTGSDDLSAFAGLSRRAPILGLVMIAAMMSLGGIPPFAGFFGKVLVFGAAIEENLVWLALVGIFNAIIGLYYYLVVLKTIYVNEPIEKEKLPKASLSWRLAMAVCVLGILLLGFWFGPFYSYAQGVTSSLWFY
ncbi:MAG: NADH-quinone oxidoreductase subunit N [Bellilinea sp.]